MKSISALLLGGLIATFGILPTVSAITYPQNPPSGEVAGGTFNTYFSNMFNVNGCPAGQALRGFSTNGVLLCILPQSQFTGFSVDSTGSGGYIPKFNATGTGLLNSLMFDNDTGIGIGTKTPAYKLQIEGGDILVNGVRIGIGAGTNNLENVVIGTGSMTVNTTGYQVVAIGKQALSTNTTGYYNTAVGAYSLSANISGNNNTAVGQSSLGANTTGGDNTGIGRIALSRNTSGISNTAIGAGAQANSLIGNSNTAIGSYALYNTTSASSNTAIGFNSLYTNTTGNQNVALGDSALFASTTASDNVAIGYQALTSAATATANTAIGMRAGYAATGSYNVFLGYFAGSTLTAGTSNIFIGNNVEPNVGITASNQLNIGNWIYGNNGNIGIGVVNPSQKLEVNGPVKIGTAGTTITAMGVCSLATAAISTTPVSYACTGLPANTSVAVSCSASSAFTTANTALYCRASGTAGMVNCNTTVANSVVMNYKCMWMQ